MAHGLLVEPPPDAVPPPTPAAPPPTLAVPPPTLAAPPPTLAVPPPTLAVPPPTLAVPPPKLPGPLPMGPTSDWQLPTEHTRFDWVQSRHVAPSEPHAVDELPLTHSPDAEQQPEHVLALHSRGACPQPATTSIVITSHARTMCLLPPRRADTGSSAMMHSSVAFMARPALTR